MKKIFKFAAAALCTLLALASCDKNKNDGPKDETVSIPDILFEGRYYGAYYSEEAGNAGINFYWGNLDAKYDEDGNEVFVGTGGVLYLDLNTELEEDADHVILAPGTYTLDDGSYSVGTWNTGEEMSYYLEVKDGVVLHDYAPIVDGTLVITPDNGGLKFTFEGSLEDNTAVNLTAVAEGRLIGRTENTLYSNMDKDVKLTTLVQGNYFNFGDLMGDGKTETFAICLADKNYDLDADAGLGDYVYIYINVEPGTETLPSGTYNAWVDYLTTEEMNPGELVQGALFWGLLYTGSWYFCPVRGYEVAFVDGHVDVEALGEDKYRVEGELLDAYGKTVTFSYNGDLPKLESEEDEAELLSVKSDSRIKVPAFNRPNYSIPFKRLK